MLVGLVRSVLIVAICDLGARCQLRRALHRKGAISYATSCGVVMTDNVLIPAEAVDLLRDGLRSQIAIAAQHVTGAEEKLGAREHPERYQDPLRCMDTLRALLQEIGWSTPPDDALVDLRIHGWALIEALQDQVSVHADMLRDLDQDDEPRHVLVHNMNALTPLALTVLLRTQARILWTGTAQSGSA